MTSEENHPPLFSTLAADPGMIDLVENFVADLPERLARILLADEAADEKAFLFEVHQLKGTSGVYGFEPLHHCLVEIESLHKTGQLETIPEKLETLKKMCKRVTPKPPP
ncbi:MAG TPA: Hpt domain-containing protein [Planctomycetes bacterium]|nr:Hpt domain-containing protein [Planctomycetota bacterium]